MKKEFIILATLLTIILTMTGCQKLAISSTFTPVYCNDYEFTCCRPVESTSTYNLDAKTLWKCPETAVNCVVTSVQSGSDGTQVYYGKQNCRITSLIGLFPHYVCDDQISSKTLIQGSTNINVPSGYNIYTYETASLSIKTVNQQLVFAGRSGSNTGVPILGSDNCAFTVSKGTIIKNGADLGTSYTIPINECVLSWQSGDRHICGNLEEQCSIDSDCSGHTYGNKECNARTLQTYGCRQLSPPNGVTETNGEYKYTGYDNVPGSNSFNGVISRCEIISSTKVECCGDTDCGSNMVCDTGTFTCKTAKEVECTHDYDCGTSTQCDYVSLTLKTPECVDGRCAYHINYNIQCCNDNNCATDQYCSNTHQCLVKQVIKKECPFECCITMNEYTDRKCPSTQFCKDNKCQSTPGCNNDDECNINQMCKSGQCVDKQLSCTPKLAGLVKGEVGIKEECDLVCKAGLKGPTQVTACVYDYSLVIGVAVILFLLLLIGGGISAAVYFKHKKN